MHDADVARFRVPPPAATPLPLGEKELALAIETQLLRAPFVRAATVGISSEGLLVAVLPDPAKLRCSRTGRYSDLLRVTVGEACHRWAPGQPFEWELLTTDEALVEWPAGPAESAAKECWTERQRQVWRWLCQVYSDHRPDLDSILQLELGVDSIDWVALCAEIEVSFGVVVSEEAIARALTVRDLLDEVERAPPAAVSGHAAVVGADDGPLPPAYAQYLGGLGVFGAVARWLMYWTVRSAVRSLFRLRIEGIERLPKQRPYSVVINHLSDLDHLVIIAALPCECLRYAHWAAEATRFFHSPALRTFSRISRIFAANDYDARWTIACGREVVRRRQVLMWFPEGWRSPDGCLQPFARGIGAVLASQPVPVVPVYLSGTFEAMPRTARRPRFNMPLRVIVGEPLDPIALSGNASERDKPARIVAALHAAMRKLEAQALGTGQAYRGP